jgi:hypothetical protein
MANTWKIKRGDTELIVVDQYDRHINPVTTFQFVEVQALSTQEAQDYADALTEALDAAEDWASNNANVIKADDLEPGDYFEDSYGKHEVHEVTHVADNDWHSKVVVSFAGLGAGYYPVGQPVRLIRRSGPRG